jgi:RNA polymerase sigma-70 factor (ECF subfamily)
MLRPLKWLKSRNVEACYSKHGPALLAYARSFDLDHHAAEDLLHRVFLKVLESPKSIDDIRPYLFRAVRNAALNQRRDSARELELSEGEPWFENHNRSREAELDLRSALRELPLEQREVLLLHVWGGLTFADIAAVLAASPNTVASRYRYAINALRMKLEPSTGVTVHDETKR